MVEPRGIEPRTDRCQRPVFPLNYGPAIWYILLYALQSLLLSYPIVKVNTPNKRPPL